jgi:hypothetical protein
MLQELTVEIPMYLRTVMLIKLQFKQIILTEFVVGPVNQLDHEHSTTITTIRR